MVRKVDPLRPDTLGGYIGQDHVKEILSVAIDAAKKEKRMLDHILVNGPPGLGKTTLANIIAKEMGGTMIQTIGTSLRTAENVSDIVDGIYKPNTFVFIDEIHRMTKVAAETLYPVMEDGVSVHIMDGMPIEHELPPTTVIGATTNMGRLPQPFVDRFGLQFQLEFYSVSDMVDIALINAEKLKMEWRQDALEEIIARSRQTPRVLNRLLRRIRDFQISLGTTLHKDQVVEILAKKFGLDNLGLTPLDRKVLRVLADTDSPMGAEAIAAMVGEEEDTYIERVEPYLIRLGFILREKRGRSITTKGKAHLKGIRLVREVA